jgi:8-oxo-dGTP diphosphatase
MNSSHTTDPIIDVAAGVIERADGRVLLAGRPAGKPWAGYWEFPGGKIEAGESVRAALTRELHEELGIELDAADPWLTQVYAYPEKTVRLHFLRVHRWHGEPHGREGQQLSWEDPAAVAVAPLLPANDRIMRSLGLPALYAITQAGKHGVEAFMPRLRTALERGVRLVQVRERGLGGTAHESFARAVVTLAHGHGARVLVNGDAELAQRVGADGVHLKAAQLMGLTAPPPAGLWAASCHNAAELARAAELGADFVALSPVLATASHPGEAGLGWQRFETLIRDYPLPVYALGGMKPELLATARAHGAHGMALLSGIW